MKIKELVKDILMGMCIGITILTLSFIISYTIMGKLTNAQLEVINLMLILGVCQGIGIGIGIHNTKNISKTSEERIKMMKIYKLFILICVLVCICLLGFLYFIDSNVIYLIAIVLTALLFFIFDLGIKLGIASLNKKAQVQNNVENDEKVDEK